jgi:hypothetical protein
MSMAIAVGDRLLTYPIIKPTKPVIVDSRGCKPPREITVWKKISSHRKDVVFTLEAS